MVRLTCDDVDDLLAGHIDGCCGGCHCCDPKQQDTGKEKVFEVDGAKVVISYCCSKEEFVTKGITDDQIRTMLNMKARGRRVG